MLSVLFARMLPRWLSRAPVLSARLWPSSPWFSPSVSRLITFRALRVTLLPLRISPETFSTVPRALSRSRSPTDWICPPPFCRFWLCRVVSASPITRPPLRLSRRVAAISAASLAARVPAWLLRRSAERFSAPRLLRVPALLSMTLEVTFTPSPCTTPLLLMSCVVVRERLCVAANCPAVLFSVSPSKVRLVPEKVVPWLLSSRPPLRVMAPTDFSAPPLLLRLSKPAFNDRFAPIWPSVLSIAPAFRLKSPSLASNPLWLFSAPALRLKSPLLARKPLWLFSAPLSRLREP